MLLFRDIYFRNNHSISATMRSDDRNWSATPAGLTIPPHIRDALERAAQEEKDRKASSMSHPEMPPTRPFDKRDASSAEFAAVKQQVEDLRRQLDEKHEKETELEATIQERDRQLRSLRGYAHDAMRLMEREHAYLRATHLDPAVALEIDLLKRRLDQKPGKDDGQAEHADLTRRNTDLVSENDELAAACAAAQAERNYLRLRLKSLQHDLDSAQEWNDQLEEEREELYAMIDDSKEPNADNVPVVAKQQHNGFHPPPSGFHDPRGQQYPPLPPQQPHYGDGSGGPHYYGGQQQQQQQKYY